MKIFLTLLLLLGLAACHHDHEAGHGHGDDAAHADHDEPAKGANGGRLLVDGDFAIELAIFETGVPPEYHAWPTLRGEPLPLEQVQLVVELTRLGNRVDRFSFTPDGSYLRGSGVVTEPHSFAVKVSATYAGKNYVWQYDSFEGRTTIPAKVAEAAGIRTELAGPATLVETLTLYGRIVAHPERQRRVAARYPGVLRTVHKKPGDVVTAGETLATVESDDSLRVYAITAPLAGTVTARDANPGEPTTGRSLFTITDTRTLMAELSVFPRDRARVQPGAALSLRLADGDVLAQGRILRSDIQAGSNQAVTARAEIESHDGSLLPGSFVTAEVAVASREVPLAVKAAGLQAFRDFTVVYALVDETYEVRMLELGAQHREWVEVLGGLRPGERYVTENSYVIKADIEKDGAAHDH